MSAPLGRRLALALAVLVGAASCGGAGGPGEVAVSAGGTDAKTVDTTSLAKSVGGCREAAQSPTSGVVFVDPAPIESSLEAIRAWVEVEPAEVADLIAALPDREEGQPVSVPARLISGPDDLAGSLARPFSPVALLLNEPRTRAEDLRRAAEQGGRVFVSLNVSPPGLDDPPWPVITLLLTPTNTAVPVGECAYERLFRILSGNLGGDEEAARFLASIIGLDGPAIVARLAELTAARTTTTLRPWRDVVLAPGEVPNEVLQALDSVGLTLQIPDAWYGHGWVICAIVHLDGKVAGTGCVDLIRPGGGWVCEGVEEGPEELDPEKLGDRCRKIPWSGPQWGVWVPDDGRVELWLTDDSDRPVQLLGEVVLPPELRHDGTEVKVVLSGEMDPATGRVAGLGFRVFASPGPGEGFRELDSR